MATETPCMSPSLTHRVYFVIPQDGPKFVTGQKRYLEFSILFQMVTTKSSENPLKLEKLGLSHSRLNDRYHSQSMERIQEISADIDIELSKVEDDNLESVSQRGENRKYSLTG